MWNVVIIIAIALGVLNVVGWIGFGVGFERGREKLSQHIGQIRNIVSNVEAADRLNKDRFGSDKLERHDKAFNDIANVVRDEAITPVVTTMYPSCPSDWSGEHSWTMRNGKQVCVNCGIVRTLL
jgi:hypothetical protein